MIWTLQKIINYNWSDILPLFPFALIGLMVVVSAGIINRALFKSK
jgi:uncharacterized membrane protein (GlpM family)